MPVNDARMGLGHWSVTLQKDTPRAVRERCWHQHSSVVITPGRLDLAVLPDAAMLAASLWTGVVLHRGAYTLGGPGLAWWLGDADDQGTPLTAPLSFTSASWSTVFSTLLGGALTLGVVPAGGSFTETYPVGVSLRAILESIVTRQSYEWRVNPDLTFDVGVATVGGVLVGSAAVLFTPGGGGRAGAGDNAELTVFDARAAAEVDWEQHAQIVMVEGRGGVGTSTTGTTEYLTPIGEPYLRTIKLDLQEVPPTLETTYANKYAADFQDSAGREEVTVELAQLGIEGLCRAGSPVYVWDQVAGIVDYTTPLPFAGRSIFPRLMRVNRLTWPVRRGMGVYSRVWFDGDAAATWTDLTPYVEFEDTPATVEVVSSGDRRRHALSNTTARADQVSQQSDRWRAAPWDRYTPTWTTSATQPTLGNGGTVGAFSRSGSTLHLRGELRVGSTSTVGTGDLRLSLPAGLVSGPAQIQAGSAWWYDAPTAAYSGSMVLDPSVGFCTFLIAGRADARFPSSALGNGDIVSWAATVELTP